MPLFGGKIDGVVSSMKVEKEISALVKKKQALQKSIQNEISQLETRITGLGTEIGLFVYEMHMGDGINIGLLTDRLNQITALKQSIAEKEQKALEIGSRYDEEIGLLKNLSPQKAAGAATARCAACGAPYAPDTDVFCGACGKKLA